MGLPRIDSGQQENAQRLLDFYSKNGEGLPRPIWEAIDVYAGPFLSKMSIQRLANFHAKTVPNIPRPMRGAIDVFVEEVVAKGTLQLLVDGMALCRDDAHDSSNFARATCLSSGWPRGDCEFGAGMASHVKLFNCNQELTLGLYWSI